MTILRRLYDWTLHWAKTPYGTWVLFLLAVAESSFFPVPPDVLLIALSLSLPHRSFFYAAVCSAGSVLGGVIGYYIGAVFMQILGCPIVGFYHGERIFDRLAFAFNQHSFWAIFIAAVTPIPYKIFTIAAGALKTDLGIFLLASLLGRPLRFFSVALLIFLFGRRVKAFIEKYFNLLSILFVILLIGGFIVLKKFSDHEEKQAAPDATPSFFGQICAGFR